MLKVREKSTVDIANDGQKWAERWEKEKEAGSYEQSRKPQSAVTDINVKSYIQKKLGSFIPQK